MYLAHSSLRNGTHIGSTRLHKDVTAAYNLSLEGSALWAIWPSWSSDMLCEFIFERGLAKRSEGNPIHQQRTYLSREDIEAFTLQYQVRPFVFRQEPGQMVFIPSNCPHQVRYSTFFLGGVLTVVKVSNEDDCIKYANDILPESQLADILAVQMELRDHRLGQQSFERLDDVLQVYQTLWYSWKNLSEKLKNFPDDLDLPPPVARVDLLEQCAPGNSLEDGQSYSELLGKAHNILSSLCHP